MSESTPASERDPSIELAVPADGPLVDRISALIEQARALVARQTNVVLTMLYWEIGRLIDVEVLNQERAEYARQIVGSLAPQLTARYGRGFDKSNLHRMIKLSQVFPDREIVGSLAPQLSWTHLTMLLPVRTDEARTFYIEQAISGRLSAKGLRELIGRQGFERKEIANAQTPGSAMVPVDSFRDPYLLDFLGLRGAYSERDLEDAIVHDLQEFLLEVGNGWAFVARQKRMTIDNDDFYLDLLFYSRPLRRLIAVELKVGRFKAAYEGQMKLYLKWLNSYERREDEEAPIGLILCTEASREQVEMLEMHKDGIVVAEYWTALPPKAELEARIQAIYRAAAERVARRELPSPDEED